MGMGEDFWALVVSLELDADDMVGCAHYEKSLSATFGFVLFYFHEVYKRVYQR